MHPPRKSKTGEITIKQPSTIMGLVGLWIVMTVINCGFFGEKSSFNSSGRLVELTPYSISQLISHFEVVTAHVVQWWRSVQRTRWEFLISYYLECEWISWTVVKFPSDLASQRPFIFQIPQWRLPRIRTPIEYVYIYIYIYICIYVYVYIYICI